METYSSACPRSSSMEPGRLTHPQAASQPRTISGTTTCGKHTHRSFYSATLFLLNLIIMRYASTYFFLRPEYPRLRCHNRFCRRCPTTAGRPPIFAPPIFRRTLPASFPVHEVLSIKSRYLSVLSLATLPVRLNCSSPFPDRTRSTKPPR